MRFGCAEEFAEQHVEVVDTVFALDGVAAAVVGGRAQAALHVFAEQNVFLLHFVGEDDSFLDAFLNLRLGNVVEEPLEDGKRFFVIEGND